jgi:aminoglycoside 6'-N-acetyltransferase
MTAEILAATEHLVLRRMTNDDAAALAAYRSDPVQARYQSWEMPYPLDSARALIAQMRNVRVAQPGVWLQLGIETSGRLIGDIAVRVDGDEARQATVGFTLAADAQVPGGEARGGPGAQPREPTGLPCVGAHPALELG